MLIIDPVKLGIGFANYDKIIEIVKRYTEIGELVVFGSRARGDFGKFSDIDICVTRKDHGFDIADFRSDLDSLEIPYLLDTIDFHEIDRNFQNKILCEGLIMWNRSEN